jgi:hypothetical protein
MSKEYPCLFGIIKINPQTLANNEQRASIKVFVDIELRMGIVRIIFSLHDGKVKTRVLCSDSGCLTTPSLKR